MDALPWKGFFYVRFEVLLAWHLEHPDAFTAWFAPALDLALRTIASLEPD